MDTFNGAERSLYAIAKRTVLLTAGSTVFLLGLCGCRSSAGKESAALVTVQAGKLQRGPISQHILADAVLSPLSQAAISPKISAPVKKLYVQRGSHVNAGELLATLDNRDLTAAAMDSKGQYEAAQAAYDTQTKALLPEQYETAKLDVTQTGAQVRLNQSIVASRQKLFSEGAIAGRDLDTAKAALVQAKTAYSVALNHLHAMQSVSQEAALKQAQGTLVSAKGRYLAAEAQVAYSQIRSPIRGVVTDRPLFAGEMASPAMPLITVMDTSALLAKVHLAQAVAQRLSVGNEAQIVIPGIKAPVPAKVSLISPALDPGSTTVEVWLRIENRAGQYKVGTPVHVSVIGQASASALKAPLSAVQTSEDGSTSVVIVGSDGAAHRRPVVLGINDGKDVQILSGLNGNETVITTGAYALDDGTKVRIGAAAEDSGASGKTD